MKPTFGPGWYDEIRRAQENIDRQRVAMRVPASYMLGYDNLAPWSSKARRTFKALIGNCKGEG